MSKHRNIEIKENVICDVCHKNKAVFSTYVINDFNCGKISIFTIKCKNCGFKKNDLLFLNPKEPAKYSIKIENSDDLSIKVIKSGDCKIKIPELGLDVNSSINSDGFITNIEGVLNKFKTQIDFLKKTTKKTDLTKLNRLLLDIEKVKSSKKKINLILEDNSGNSMIISDRVKISKI
jgi:zinc finger protein